MLYCLQRELQLEFTCRLLEIYLKRENNNPSLKSCKNWDWFHIPFHYREQSVPYQSLASFKHSEFSPVLSRNFIFQDTRYWMCGNECDACWKRDFLQTSSWTTGKCSCWWGGEWTQGREFHKRREIGSAQKARGSSAVRYWAAGSCVALVDKATQAVHNHKTRGECSVWEDIMTLKPSGLI